MGLCSDKRAGETEGSAPSISKYPHRPVKGRSCHDPEGRLALSILLLAISAAGCTKVYYHRFFFLQRFFEEWDAYMVPYTDCSLAVTSDGMALNDVLVVSKFAFSYNFTATVEFETNIDKSGPVESFYLIFLDCGLPEWNALFALGFGGIGDEGNGYYELLEDTLTGEPVIIADGDVVPPSMHANGMNKLTVQRTGSVIKCSLNGVLFAEGDLQSFPSGFVVPMLDVSQKDGETSDMMNIRSFSIAYDGEKRELPLHLSSASEATGLNPLLKYERLLPAIP